MRLELSPFPLARKEKSSLSGWQYQDIRGQWLLLGSLTLVGHRILAILLGLVSGQGDV